MPSRIGDFGVEVCDDMRAGLEGADVVMMLRLQKERMDGGFIPSEREYYHRWGLDAFPDAQWLISEMEREIVGTRLVEQFDKAEEVFTSIPSLEESKISHCTKTIPVLVSI